VASKDVEAQLDFQLSLHYTGLCASVREDHDINTIQKTGG